MHEEHVPLCIAEKQFTLLRAPNDIEALLSLPQIDDSRSVARGWTGHSRASRYHGRPSCTPHAATMDGTSITVLGFLATGDAPSLVLV